MTTTCPEERFLDNERLVALIPYLVGFHPRDALVLTWWHAGTLVLTERVDLPPPAVLSDAVVEEWLRAALPASAVQASDAVAVVLYADHGDDLAPWVGLTDRLCATVWDLQCRVLEVLHVAAGRWRNLACTAPQCCPPGGRAVSADVEAEVADTFALRGRTVLPDRGALTAQVAADPDAVAQVQALLPARPRRRRRGDRWRDRAIDDLVDLLTGRPGPVPAQRRATALRALYDVKVRDTVLWELGQADADGLLRATVALAGLTRSAPDTLCAPAATCCAIAAWLTGDGALASVAIDRALAAEPRYALGGLVEQALRAGWPPRTWRELVAEIDRDTCRHGLTPLTPATARTTARAAH